MISAIYRSNHMVLNIPAYFTPYLFIPAFQTQSLEEDCTAYAWLPSLSATHPLHWDQGQEAFNNICPINNQKAPTKNNEIVRWYQVTHHCPVKTTLSACFSSMLHQGLAVLSSQFWQWGKPTQISHPRDKSGRREKAKFLPQEDGCSFDIKQKWYVGGKQL